MEGKEYFKFLLDRYSAGQATEEEQQELFVEIIKNEDDMDWAALLEEHLRKPRPEIYNPDRWEPVVNTILKNEGKPRPRILLWTRVAAAIVIGLLVLSGTYFLLNRKAPKDIAQAPRQEIPVADVAPGGDRATLTLADGTVVFLDSAAKGTLTDQGGITVINLDGQLAYQGEESKAAEVLYNTVSTPRGGQYQLVLADGSRVWLNAASSLRFPTSFPGEERTVELTGEGYFEVAHNAAKPFHVRVGELDVEVLGTHFNINSYSDEPFLKTTLLEGRVSVARNEKKVILNPGQQAVADPEGASIRVSYKVDVEEAIAWKNGLIYFDGADVGMVMRQIARWYDVEVAYTGNIKAAHLSGKVSRKLNLTQVIRVLEESGIDIKAEGKKLTATPKL